MQKYHITRLVGRLRGGISVGAMRHTVFRRKLADEFGEVRSEMLAQDHVLSSLGGRTIDQALEAGVHPKEVWRAICEAFDVPAERR